MQIARISSLLLLAGCGGPSAPAPLPSLDLEDLPATVTLSPGGSVVVAGATITFEAVPSDSRCPKDVNCAWAGNAALTVRIDPNVVAAWPTYRVTLNSTLEPHGVDLKEPIRLTLEQLTPEPVSTERTTNYQAELRISKR